MDLVLLGLVWWLWPIYAIVFGVLVAITAWEKPLSGLVFLAAAVVGVAFLQGVNPFTWFAANAGTALTYAGLYLLIGVAFAYAKWTWFYLPSDEVQAKIADAFKYFKKDLPTSNLSEDEELELFAQSSNYPFGLRKDKWRIATWAIWWPTNLFWTLIDDVLKGLVNWFGNALSGSFAAIAKSQVRKTLKAQR